MDIYSLYLNETGEEAYLQSCARTSPPDMQEGSFVAGHVCPLTSTRELTKLSLHKMSGLHVTIATCKLKNDKPAPNSFACRPSIIKVTIVTSVHNQKL
jgi:hypothetical protein